MALEHSGVIQATIEGLSLQQIYIRDDLFQKYRGRGLDFASATKVVLGEKKLSAFGIADEEYEKT